MNNQIVQTLLVLLAINQLSAAASDWEAFKEKHGLKFETRLEESMRESLFNENKAEIERFNAEQADRSGYSLGLNHFASWTREEFERLNRDRLPEEAIEHKNSPEAQKFIDDLMAGYSDDDIPAEVDWTKVDGRVSPVRDSGNCSCAYAITAAGALEGQMARQNKSMVQLSVQNLIDCSVNNTGCDGGLIGYSWDDIKAHGGIEAEKTYPFVGRRQSCLFNKSRSVFTDAGGIVVIRGESNLKRIVAIYGPVAVMIDASLKSFTNYKEGIYYDKSCSNFILFLNHSCLVVGYGTDAATGADYWLIKNSWGTDWGMKGYFKLARNRRNACGVASFPIFPIF